MKILAFSDLHGDGFIDASALVEVHQPDWIVLCGDMLPDFSNLQDERRLEAQRSFWKDQRGAFLREGCLTTYVLGNHELAGFRDPDMNGIPPELAGRVLRLEGIPGDSGPFSFARGWPAESLRAELEMQLRLTPTPSIYLSHAPPFGSLDRTYRGEHIGHKPLFENLQARDWPKALVLCGHVHHGFGLDRVGKTIVVNLATGYALMEWKETQVNLLAMARIVKGGSFYDAPWIIESGDTN